MAKRAVMQAPAFEALEANGIDPQTGDPSITFRGVDQRSYQIRLKTGIVDMLIAALVSHVTTDPRKKPPPSGQSDEYQHLTLLGVQKLASEEGRVGLMLYFDGGIKLPLLIPVDTIPLLQAELSALQDIGRESGPERPVH